MSDPNAPYDCSTCGWIYDPAVGDPDGGIPPGTPFDAIPDDWVCPVCGAPKSAFTPRAADARAQAGAASALPDGIDADRPIVILGSGLGGVSLVRAIRARAPQAPITLVTADDGAVYPKPMLSNALAQGRGAGALVEQSGAAFADSQAITLRAETRVAAIDRDAQALVLESGERLSYGRLVLALGADPRVPPTPGAKEAGIATVNDRQDYAAWHARLHEGGGPAGKRVLLIGAGLIGCEFANDLASVGARVVVVDPARWPLSRLLPEALGTRLAEALAPLGARVLCGRSVARFEQGDGAGVAVLDDDTREPFDLALSAVGLSPRTSLAADAGLETGAGIRVDGHLATRDPAVFALGDCAETPAGVLPYVAPLLAAARCLAATLTGTPTPLALPALPVIVKTPALPLVTCPPPAGAEGAWRAAPDALADDANQQGISPAETGAYVFEASDGRRLGFALAGAATSHRAALAATLPPLLATEGGESGGGTLGGASPDSLECDQCGWIYDPAVGDPEGGIAPGTPFDAIPDDWVCPVCGAPKSAFVPLGAEGD